MFRGEIWTKGDRDAYVLIGSDRLGDARTRPPIAWAIPVTAEPQPKKFTEPFVVSLSPTQTGLTIATWVLVAHGILPLRQSELTRKMGSVDDKAMDVVDAAVRILYDL